MIPIMQIDNGRTGFLIEICSLRSDFIITFSLSIVYSNKKKTCLPTRRREKEERCLRFLFYFGMTHIVCVNSSHRQNKWSVVFIRTYLHLEMRERRIWSSYVCANWLMITDFFFYDVWLIIDTFIDLHFITDTCKWTKETTWAFSLKESQVV